MDGSDRITVGSCKVKKVAVMKRLTIALGISLAGCGISYLAAGWYVTSLESFMFGLFWICIGSLFVFIKTYTLRCSELSKLIVIIAYLFRLAIAAWGTYGTGAVINFLNAGDQHGFLRIARQYYERDFSQSCTYYPYVIFWIFKVAGRSRMMPQLFNIMCWYVGILLLMRLGEGFYKKRECILLCFYAFMPWPLLISTQLYREPMMSLLMMLIYFLCWRWMNYGQFGDMIMAALLVAPLFLLHGGNIVMWPILFITYVHWDYKRQKWRVLSGRCMVYSIGLLVSLIFVKVIIPQYGTYLPTSFSLEALTSYAYYPARADYIPENVSIKSWDQFWAWTVYRMMYFWISPSPRFWNSAWDFVGFAVDAVPWLVLLAWMIIGNRKHKNPQIMMGSLLILLYIFVYGWGTRNAGTAMRHRGQLLGIVVMTVLVGMRGQGGCYIHENSIFNRQSVWWRRSESDQRTGK